MEVNWGRKLLQQVLNSNRPVEAIAVAVRLPSGALEIITNTQDVRGKIRYYLTNYDNDLKLKANPAIQIVDLFIV